MQAREWRDRVLSTTRGEILGLLRRGPKTVSELAEEVGLTGNAVRAHLAVLERDRLIEQEGVRRGVGKPAAIYRMTEEAEGVFPKGYAAVLREVFGLLEDRLDPGELEEFVRSVGRRAAASAEVEGLDRGARMEAAVAFLGELGAAAEIEEQQGGGVLIRGFSCPLSAVVGQHPEACVMVEELVAQLVGAPVRECCDRSGRPRCSFRVGDGGG